MSKSFGICAAGLALGLTLQGCGDSAPITSVTTTATTTSTTTTTTTTPALTNVPNSALMFVGRWYPEDGHMKTSWGQSLTTQFSNSTRVSLTMRSEGGRFYSYRIDDGEWTKAEGRNGRMLLAEGLDPTAEHTVRFGKCDESSEGVFDFEYLELDAGYTASPPARQLVYHAIGDSITAGFKAECAAIDAGGSSCDSGSHSTENVYQTYVRHLADAWGTDEWSAVARTGVGVGDIIVGAAEVLAEHKFLDLYKCREWYGGGACLNPWDFASQERQPDVITINLGTNDYVYGDPTDEVFQRGYVELVQLVHSLYPAATIFCIAPLQYTIAGPLPNHPPNKWTNMNDNVRAVVDTIASNRVIFVPTGNVSFPPLDRSTDYVDDTHPTADGHAKFATFLEAAMTPVIRQNHPGLLPPAEHQAQPTFI